MPSNRTLFAAFAAVAVMCALAAPAAASPMGASSCDGTIVLIRDVPHCIGGAALVSEPVAAEPQRRLSESLSACGCTCECSGFLCGMASSAFKPSMCSDSSMTGGAKTGDSCTSLEAAANKKAKPMGVTISKCTGTFSTGAAAARRMAAPAAPAVPVVHVSARLSAALLLAVGIVVCLFGYQCHSLVFAYSGYVLGYALYGFVYALAVADGASYQLTGWNAWGAILAGVVFALVGASSTNAGLNFTATAVGTAAAGVVYHAWTYAIAGDARLVAGLTWLGCVLIVVALVHAFTKPALIAGTAALGAFYIANSAATLGWNNQGVSVATGLGLESSWGIYLVLGALFVLGALVQWALSRGDEFDLHGNRRWYPTRFSYAQQRKTGQQQQQGQKPIVAETGTTLVYGV